MYQPIDPAEREDHGRERHDMRRVGLVQVKNGNLPTDREECYLLQLSGSERRSRGVRPRPEAIS